MPSVTRTRSGVPRVFADGFTSVIDLAWADDTLLVLELVKEGLLAAEAGTAPPIGALWRCRVAPRPRSQQGR